MKINLYTVIFLLVVLLIVYMLTSKKNENMNYSRCPPGFHVSLNKHACVLPGEKLPPCLEGQKYVDRACRYPLENTPIPDGWHINYTDTGIKQY